MPTGGCFCGALQYETGLDIKAKALCHCVDCRKITGSTYSTNYIIPQSDFKFTKGTPKTYSKTADSGNEITNYFCGDCGSLIFRKGATFGDNQVLKVGTLDDHDALDKAKPDVELYAGERVAWVEKTAGTSDKPGMP
ncbi:hypothetical protein K461DRAFT_276272 [Myriangium duriaei CBS 260.36]|uniref:CENP-V/GFA domain-containing protein n=1 Tax=Myriangium duriaei CBS 260.36 TaxID=1168546 RepID=A0A9P4MHR3_9PEZI|nr:hypothetical protein K461DRAFT_276272 [Myriangium duriaei CBS 260.36]